MWKKPESNATICFEAKQRLAADKLRNKMDAAEYKTGEDETSLRSTTPELSIQS